MSMLIQRLCVRILDDANWRLSETRKSFSYKLGLALTALPRWIRGRQ
ncbi:MAG: hypothetical protein J6N47_06305 [Lachnospiraceae bacterium]|nr:hypothetical protein [Lachnospiraceae bacterium]